MLKKQDKKTYFCPYLGRKILGVVARSCNYSNLETYTCNHDEKPCVAKEGMILFAKKLSEGNESIVVDFRAAREAQEQSKRLARYDRIGHLADHLFPETKYRPGPVPGAGNLEFS